MLTCRGQACEISRNLLFQLITVVIDSHHEMEDFLAYELSQQPPTLFQYGLLRKNNKTDMSTALKGSVVESSLTTSDNISVVIDGGHLLNTVKWPTDATYPDIATNYGKHVCTQFTGMPVIVVFDGYGSAATPTKNTEHQLRLQRTVSRDILFDASVKPFVPRHSFLGNPTNKTLHNV